MVTHQHSLPFTNVINVFQLLQNKRNTNVVHFRSITMNKNIAVTVYCLQITSKTTTTITAAVDNHQNKVGMNGEKNAENILKKKTDYTAFGHLR